MARSQVKIKQTAGRDALGEFAPEFAHLNDDILFGEVWSRNDLLSLRDRSIVTVVALMSQGLTDSSFKYHLESAKKNGVTKTEMAEILTHAAFYAGWPKAWAPGWWEVSGGAAQAGEASYDAVLREVKEETGLDVKDAEGGYMFTYKRENPGEGDNYFVDVYRFTLDIDDSDVNFQEAEIDGYMFASIDEIKVFAQEGIFLHYDSIKKVFE